ncbi:MAG: ABC transporter permease [Deltaproteobacteria bacterium]|nr:ABC transporter permease [Deltaproteobacteria bacterium]
MIFESFVALRYLRAKKSTRTLSLLAGVSLAGIFVSVFSFFVIHSVMNGFSLHLRAALVGFQSHLRVTRLPDSAPMIEWLKKKKGVQYVTPVIEFDGIIRTPTGDSAGAKMRGMTEEDRASDDRITITYFGEATLADQKGALPGLVIGEDLYARLQFNPGRDETVSLIYPFGDIGPTGEVEPRRRNFAVIGVLNTGFYEFDARYLLINPKEARALSGGEAGHDLLVRLSPKTSSERMKADLLKAFPESNAVTWEEQNSRLMKALKLERVGMFLLLSIVTFIASFNVFALMTILTLGKSGEISLFYFLGAAPRQLKIIFRKVGAFIGIAGTVGGLAAGFIVLAYFKWRPLELPPAYYLDYLPVQIDLRVALLLFVMAPLFTILASFLPVTHYVKVSTLGGKI